MDRIVQQIGRKNNCMNLSLASIPHNLFDQAHSAVFSVDKL
jgi:hypothetical protein